MSNSFNTTSTYERNAHNIMAAGSKDRPPMLGPGRYSQWHSRFLRYLDTKSNGEYLRKCIFEGPYMPTNVLIAAVEAAENILHSIQNEVMISVLRDLPEVANPLVLLSWLLNPYSDNYYQAPNPQDSKHASYKQSSSTRTSASTRHKGKEIAKPVTTSSESVSEEDIDTKQPRRDKDIKSELDPC
ncbi:hypothetical protein Tco_0923319 [Tanacetum coccineum]|uniref:Uncharacterized protein n=1 Tax=Tanacetum coccineum TaxID=301880 RepID=A0ABQ5D0M2_9ASTR